MIQNRLRREALAEELRILYVAMTRARERLYLVGSVANRGSKIDQWQKTTPSQGKCGVLSQRLLAAARSPLDWIGPAVLPDHVGSTFVLRQVGLEGVRSPAATANDHGVPDPVEGAPAISTGNRIAEALSWQYPGLAAATLAAKATVSELKGRLVDAAEDPVYDLLTSYVPESVPTVGGVELGSAVHMLLQHADFAQSSDLDYLTALRARLLAQDIIVSEVADHMDLSLISDFFSRELGLRLARAERVWREVPFSMMIDLEEVYPNAQGQEQVMLQGIIDCLFLDGGKLIMLDFKTDRSLRLFPAYRKQLHLYQRAVERLFGRSVDQAYLSFIALKQDIMLSADAHS
jgi:ATP-dependent helicase/nuclease subunit A